MLFLLLAFFLILFVCLFVTPPVFIVQTNKANCFAFSFLLCVVYICLFTYMKPKMSYMRFLSNSKFQGKHLESRPTRPSEQASASTCSSSCNSAQKQRRPHRTIITISNNNNSHPTRSQPPFRKQSSPTTTTKTTMSLPRSTIV